MDNIHKIGSARQSGKTLNAEGQKLQQIIDLTELHIGKITFEGVKTCLKNIPEVHHSVIEEAVRERNIELLGTTVLMAIYQLVQDDIKKANYS